MEFAKTLAKVFAINLTATAGAMIGMVGGIFAIGRWIEKHDETALDEKE